MANREDPADVVENDVLARVKDLFEGRTDTYLQEGRNGKAFCVHEPLTRQTWLDHLYGRRRIGSYGLQREGSDVLVVDGITLDLDGKNRSRFPDGRPQALTVARDLISLAEELSLPAYLYLSRSQQGFHVRMFGRLPRHSAQHLGSLLVARVLETHGLCSEAIEVFPKGSPDVDLGGTVFAEYFGLLTDGGGHNLQVDTNGQPLSDQIAHLLEIQSVSPDRVAEALAHMRSSHGDQPSSSAGDLVVSAPPTRGDWVAEALRGAEVGYRNDTCARLAGHFLFKGIGEEACVEILRAWNHRNTEALEEQEVIRTVRGVFQRYRRAETDNPFERPLDLANLSEVDEAIPWLVDGLAARGDLTLITGLPDSAKSLLSCHLAYCLAAGKSMLGRFQVPKPVSVAMVSADNPSRVDKLRLRRVAAGLETSPSDVQERLVWFSRRDLIFDEKTVGHLKAFLEQHPVDVLIVDTLGAVFPDDVCAGDAIRAFIRTAIRPIIDAFDMAVFVVHHHRKHGGKGTPNDPGNSILGSVSLWASVDGHWSLKARGEDHFSFIHHKCRWPERIPAFIFRSRDTEDKRGVVVEYLEDTTQQTARTTEKRKDAKAALTKALSESPGYRLSPKDALSKLGEFSSGTVKRAAEELEQEGRLRRDPEPPKRCRWWSLVQEEHPDPTRNNMVLLPGLEQPPIGSDHHDY